MRTPLIIFCLVLSHSFVGCGKSSPGREVFNATVLSTHDASCGYPVLQIADVPSYMVRIPGDTSSVFVVLDLPANLNTAGNKLSVSIDTVPANRDFACMTFGITYPHLRILSAKRQ